MKAALKDIQNGKFAKEWIKEYESGYKRYNALLKAGEKHPIEKTGARLRGADALDQEEKYSRCAGRVLTNRLAGSPEGRSPRFRHDRQFGS